MARLIAWRLSRTKPIKNFLFHRLRSRSRLAPSFCRIEQYVDAILAEAELLVHPECGCASSCLNAVACGDLPAERVHVLSTEGMLQRAAATPARDVIVATESGVIHRMQQARPEQQFHAVSERAICRYMKTITLEKLEAALRLGQHEVTVAPEVAERARGAIERMVSIV